MPAENIPDPPSGINLNLKDYWKKPVANLVTVANKPIDAGQAERHRIYSLLVMALTAGYWNGNKRGQDGTYPWRVKQRLANGMYKGDRYLGHNIACVAVDGNGEVVDFEFNHNEIFNSSAEHAETRLVRRMFNLTRVYDSWQTEKANESTSAYYGNLLSNVTIYTSLESCAQCSGVMALGNVDKVVYLQTDPGQYLIGNTMYNLTRPLKPAPPPPPGTEPKPKYGAPEPISADIFGFQYKKRLDDAFAAYAKEVANNPDKPFFIDKNQKKDTSVSITSFLCTDDALDIYEAAAAEFKKFDLQHGGYTPEISVPDKTRLKNNAAALKEAQMFLDYAINRGFRASPHR